MKKQEYVGSQWIEDAKIEAAIEKSMKIEKWVKVNITAFPPDTTDRSKEVILHTYDLPRHMWQKYNWVIDWRMAKCKCKHPKLHVTIVLGFYDKKSGLELGFGTLISRLISLKANVTKWNNRLITYKERNKMDLFFNEGTDPIIMKMKTTILEYEYKIKLVENDIKRKLETKNKQVHS